MNIYVHKSKSKSFAVMKFNVLLLCSMTVTVTSS